MAWYRWQPYVPVARRRQKARQKMEALRKKGHDIQPIEIEGRKIATTFWGEAWCDHLESFSDFANRLPRGRTYVRNGSVCHLAIAKGKIEAKVSGSEIYDVRVRIKTLPAKIWSAVKKRCSGQIGSLLELLRGDLSGRVMEVVTDRKTGLFPLSDEISFDCDCPDWAVMCKHVAAVLYGVGARLDEKPALLFHLRGVNHDELIDADAQIDVSTTARRGGSKRLASDDLGDVFGIDLTTDEPEVPPDDTVKATRKVKKKKKRGKATRTSATNNVPSAKKKAPSKRTAKKGAKKVAARKKKPTKVAKKTTGRQSTKKKSSRKVVATRKTVRKKSTKRPRRVIQPVS